MDEELLEIGRFSTRSGLSVAALRDAVHQRALKAGAHEVQPPEDFAWKPRSSIIDDPSGNRIQPSQG
jgi:uncharacterized glyoxalase superfamily protein PhnB